MNLRKLITTVAIAALPLLPSTAADAATFIVPVAGTGPGANSSQWQSELTLHTAAPRPVTFSVYFRQGSDALGPVEVTLLPRATYSIADVARSKFGVTSGIGSLVIQVPDRDARTVAITSRTSNVSPTGEFGQDIPSVNLNDALRFGDIAALSGPANAATSRFNFGIFTTESTTVEWRVVRADGIVAASKETGYPAGTHAQYNSGIESLLGVAPQNNDTVHARVIGGRAVFYGSIVNATGDPTFIPGIRTREDILIQLTGVDLDENGTVDLRDDNGDGVLDTAVRIHKSAFPNYFQVVAKGEFGEAVTLEIVSAPGHADLLDANGTIRLIAGSDVTGAAGELVLRATSEGSTQLITIPLVF